MEEEEEGLLMLLLLLRRSASALPPCPQGSPHLAEELPPSEPLHDHGDLAVLLVKVVLKVRDRRVTAQEGRRGWGIGGGGGGGRKEGALQLLCRGASSRPLPFLPLFSPTPAEEEDPAGKGNSGSGGGGPGRRGGSRGGGGRKGGGRRSGGEGVGGGKKGKEREERKGRGRRGKRAFCMEG